MRILLTADPELPVPPQHYGGIERIVASLASEYRRRGHVVGLVAHHDSTADTDDFFPWPAATSSGMGNQFANARHLRHSVERFQADVVHSFSRLSYLLSLVDRGVPRIMSYQREPTGRTVSLSRRVHRDRLSFTGCSEYICANGRARGGGDWTAIPNFVDVNGFQFSESVADDAPLVFLSRIEPIKGAHLAIEIARRSNRRLIIAGNHATSGEHAEYWTREIESQLSLGSVEYVGPVNDQQKNELLGKAAAMVVPIQWNEPFGIVFAESLACGTPVISCPRGALPEIVDDNVHGFLIRSVEEGIEAVSRLPCISRAACRRCAEQMFSTGIVATKYEYLYSRVSGAR